jgi:hypothetical protein
LARQFTELLALFAVLIFLGGTMPAAGNGFPGPLKMQGIVTKGTDGGYYLDVALTNDGNEPISISAVKLPWAADHWDSWIKAFKLDAKKTQLEPGGALIDYGGQLLIKPKDSLKGRVPLHAMFRTLLNDIDARGVMIVWRCPTDLVPVACSAQTSRFVVSKTGIQEEK